VSRPDALGAVDLVSAAHDLLTHEQQIELSKKLGQFFEGWARAHGKAPTAILYFLLSFAWGWARTRCTWRAGALQAYCVNAYTILDSKRGPANDG
jgi:hypothetical protein